MKNLRREYKKRTYLNWSNWIAGMVSGIAIHSVMIYFPVMKGYDLIIVVPLVVLGLHFANKVSNIYVEEDIEFKEFLKKHEDEKQG